MKNTLISAGCVILLIAGCGEKKAGKEKVEKKEIVLARIGKYSITERTLKKRLNQYSPALRARYSTPEGQKELLEKLIEEKVLLYLGEIKGYAKDPQIVERINQYKASLYKGRLYREVSKKLPSIIKSDTLKKYYEEHINEFMAPPMVRLNRLITDTKEKAEKARDELKKGVPFKKVVEKYSPAPSLKARSGDTGYIKKGSIYPPQLEKVAFSLKKGEISKPFQTPIGWEVVQLIDKKEAQPMSFSTAIPRIRSKIINELRQEKIESILDEIRTRVGVEIYWDRLEDITGFPKKEKQE